MGSLTKQVKSARSNPHLSQDDSAGFVLFDETRALSKDSDVTAWFSSGDVNTRSTHSFKTF
jgi:hypothetical protein